MAEWAFNISHRLTLNVPDNQSPNSWRSVPRGLRTPPPQRYIFDMNYGQTAVSGPVLHRPMHQDADKGPGIIGLGAHTQRTEIRVRHVPLFSSVRVCLSIFLSICISLSLYLALPLPLSLSVCHPISVAVSVFLCVSLRLCICVCISLSLCLCLSL